MASWKVALLALAAARGAHAQSDTLFPPAASVLPSPSPPPHPPPRFPPTPPPPPPPLFAELRLVLVASLESFGNGAQVLASVSSALRFPVTRLRLRACHFEAPQCSGRCIRESQVIEREVEQLEV